MGDTEAPRAAVAPRIAALLLCGLVAGCALPAGDKLGPLAGPLEGALEASDPTLASGEHFDAYPVQAAVGERITLDLQSEDFDTYLVLITPSGRWIENDDHDGSAKHSRIEVMAQESGEWTVYATSLEGGQVGSYRLQAATAEVDLAGYRFESGELADGDDSLLAGELADSLTLVGEAGEYVWIDLRSPDFDPYLILRSPQDEQFENDDHQGDLSRSVLGMTLPASGEYQVLVTSSRPGERGRWDLTVRQGLRSGPGHRREEGELAEGDAQLRSGEHVDEYLVEGLAGQVLTLTLTSPDFDSYLVLVDPEGQRLENDDHGESPDSFLQTRLRTPGTHRVLVTSYEPGQSGRYGLEIELGEIQPVGEVAEIGIGESRSGRLEPGDEALETGELVDRYRFRAQAGTPVEITLTSEELDTYLALYFPDGAALGNDDDWDRSQRSRLELTLPLTGTYEVEASSYGPGETGAYLLELNPTTSSALPEVRGAPSRTFALLVGISDYGGRASPLESTAEDASSLQQVLLARTDTTRENTLLLLDDEATVSRFRASLAELTSRMTPADQLLVFFSGHGGRVRRGSYQAADPDSVDETLSFYDEDLTDDEMATLMNRVPGRLLLVLDSCFSGGFAKDVISAPGRMGLFSSEEDVTSSVADKFRAGGYLAVFLNEAITGDWADDGDRLLTTLELSHYLHERYRTDVKGGGADDWVRTDHLLGYQRLVVDRGSLGPADVLFRLR